MKKYIVIGLLLVLGCDSHRVDPIPNSNKLLLLKEYPKEEAVTEYRSRLVILDLITSKKYYLSDLETSTRGESGKFSDDGNFVFTSDDEFSARINLNNGEMDYFSPPNNSGKIVGAVDENSIIFESINKLYYLNVISGERKEIYKAKSGIIDVAFYFSHISDNNLVMREIDLDSNSGPGKGHIYLTTFANSTLTPITEVPISGHAVNDFTHDCSKILLSKISASILDLKNNKQKEFDGNIVNPEAKNFKFYDNNHVYYTHYASERNIYQSFLHDIENDKDSLIISGDNMYELLDTYIK